VQPSNDPNTSMPPQSTPQPPYSPAAQNFPTQPATHYPTQGQSVWDQLTGRFRAASAGQRAGILVGGGCATLIVVCLLCTLASAALGRGITGGTPDVGAVTSTHTAAPAQQRAAASATSAPASTATPTSNLTATATSTPQPKPTATPKPRPTATPKPKPTCIPGAVNCNPWGYNFTHGSHIYNPAGRSAPTLPASPTSGTETAM
jgi:hypothetical protein